MGFNEWYEYLDNIFDLYQVKKFNFFFKTGSANRISNYLIIKYRYLSLLAKDFVININLEAVWG